MALQHIFKSFEHVLSPWIADIFSVGHEIVETFVSRLNVIPGGSFNEDHELESNFEKEQIGFNPFGVWM